MDHTAIKQIQETKTLAELSERLVAQKTSCPTLAVPNNFEIRNLEQYMPQRSSYRLRYETISLSAFETYCKTERLNSSMCFVDTENMTAKTIFDLGTPAKPLHQRHSARLIPTPTSAYEALTTIASQKNITQKTAVEFIEDWASHVVLLDEQSLPLETKAAIVSMRNVTIQNLKDTRQRESNFSKDFDVMEKVEVTAGNLPRPAFFTFVTNPFLDFKTVDIKVRINIHQEKQSNLISYSFDIVNFSLLQEEIGEEFLRTLKSRIGDAMPVFIGTV